MRRVHAEPKTREKNSAAPKIVRLAEALVAETVVWVQNAAETRSGLRKQCARRTKRLVSSSWLGMLRVYAAKRIRKKNSAAPNRASFAEAVIAATAV